MDVMEFVERADGNAPRLEHNPGVLKEPLPDLLLIAGANRYILHNPIFEPGAVSIVKLGVMVVVGITDVKVDAAYPSIVLAIRTEVVEVTPTIDHSAPTGILAEIRGLGRGTAKADVTGLNVNAESFQKVRTVIWVNVEPKRGTFHNAGALKVVMVDAQSKSGVNLQGTSDGFLVALSRDGHGCGKKKYR
jgi:hypothetical protein